MEGLAITIRWLHFWGASLTVGVFAFLVLVGGPAARAIGPEGLAAFRPLDARLVRLGLWAIALTLASGVLDLARQGAVASGLDLAGALTPATLGAVLAETRYGTVWLIRHALLVLAALLLLFREREDAAPDWLAVRLQVLGLSVGSLSVIGASGHAASVQQAPLRAIVVDAAHLAGTGVWFGALLPLAFFLRWVRRLPEGSGWRVAADASRRFSTLGLVAVGAIVASGVYNAWVQVASVPALLGTPYGQWLCLKVALLVPLLGVAGVNRVVLMPRLRAAAAGGAATVPGSGALERLRRQVLGEVALGTAIIGVVALLGVITPARHDPISWPLSFRFAWAATKNLPGVQPRVAVGSQLAVLGLVTILLTLIIRRRRRGLAALGGTLAVLLGAGVALPSLAVDANPTTYLRPAEPYAAGSIVEGARLYRTHCVACHGLAGYGDGPAAAGLSPRPADLTAKHTGDHTAGDLFWWLTHGIRGSAMPGFASQLTPGERWDLINYVRLLGAAEQARPYGPVAIPRPSIVVPDFSYTTGIGESHALRDARGQGIVLLVLFSVSTSLDRLVALNEVYASVKLVGGEIIGIPLQPVPDLYRTLGDRPIFFPIAVDGAADAAAIYAMFRRDLSAEGEEPNPPPPRHMELLVDRQGYLRARWIPNDGGGWRDPARLLAEVARLSREAPLAPLPTEHVH